MNQTVGAQNILANKRSLGAWIASAWVTFFAVLFFTWWLLPVDMTNELGSFSARMTFTMAHIFMASLLLFLGFLAVGATRWQLETSDPTANPTISGGRAAKISLNNRVHTQFLSNSTEQFVMFAASMLAATPFLAPSYLRIVTLMTILWIFGRLFFWGGYWFTASRGLPTYPRAIGLGMGLLCTLVLAAIAAIGTSQFFPDFSPLSLGSSAVLPSTGFAFSELLMRPQIAAMGSNILPIGFISLVVAMVAALAIWPRLAPPVVPMAAISVTGWIWLLASGAVPVRW